MAKIRLKTLYMDLVMCAGYREHIKKRQDFNTKQYGRKISESVSMQRTWMRGRKCGVEEAGEAA